MRKFTYSLGNYIEDTYGKDFLDKIWSEKNTKTAYEYFPNSGKKVWFKCPNGVHEDEEKKICNANNRGFRCHKCTIIEQHNEQKKSLIGQKFGKLFVREYYTDKKPDDKNTYYLCDCDCGTTNKIVARCNLVRGATRSCGCLRHENCGENHYNWHGGITSEVMKIRNSKSYKEWRTAVFERDDYVCQCCGKHGKQLNAHHIYSFSKNEDRRLDVSNGITLCKECHSFDYKGLLHNTYGVQNVTPKQLEKYINDKRHELGIVESFSLNNFFIITQTV